MVMFPPGPLPCRSSAKIPLPAFITTLPLTSKRMEQAELFPGPSSLQLIVPLTVTLLASAGSANANNETTKTGSSLRPNRPMTTPLLLLDISPRRDDRRTRGVNEAAELFGTDKQK